MCRSDPTPMRAREGFSIVELSIAVAIIVVISAIAVPGFLRSHIAANEALAIGSLQQIDAAQTTYFATYTSGYAASLAQLGPASGAPGKSDMNAAGILDRRLGCQHQPCVVSGYGFAIENAERLPSPAYRSVSLPLRRGITGGRGFCDDQSHKLRYDRDGSANCREKLE